MTESEIIEVFKKGSQKEANHAIAYIYEAYFPMIERFILNNSGNTADAEDIFQEVLIILYRNIQTGKFEGKSSIKTYLYAIASNSWLSQLKKISGKVITTDLKVIPSSMHPIEDIDINEFSKEKKQLITLLVQQMNTSCKNILTDFYYKQLSIEEIKERYSLANKQVAKTKKYRCLKKLIDAFNSKKDLINQY